MDTTNIQYKAEKVGMLLARSPLDQEIKEIILNNLALLHEKDVDYLLASLSREEKELKSFALKLNTFFEKQDDNWKRLEAQQNMLAAKLLSDFFADIDKEYAGYLKADI